MTSLSFLSCVLVKFLNFLFFFLLWLGPKKEIQHSGFRVWLLKPLTHQTGGGTEEEVVVLMSLPILVSLPFRLNASFIAKFSTRFSLHLFAFDSFSFSIFCIHVLLFWHHHHVIQNFHIATRFLRNDAISYAIRYFYSFSALITL